MTPNPIAFLRDVVRDLSATWRTGLVPFSPVAGASVGGLLLVGAAYAFEKGIVAVDGPILLFAGVVTACVGGSAFVWHAAQTVAKTVPTRPLGSPTGVASVSDRALHIDGAWK